MVHDDKERQDGMKWLFGAGLVAVAFSLFLFWSDEYLSNSPREQVLSDTLLELRGAQHSLPTGASDRTARNYRPGPGYDNDLSHEFTYINEKDHGHGHHADSASEEHPEDSSEPLH